MKTGTMFVHITLLLMSGLVSAANDLLVPGASDGLTAGGGDDHSGGGGEFCQNEKFEADCPAGRVVVITAAMYGRMRLSRCVDRDYGYVSCGVDVRRAADALCSGRRRCVIPVPNSLLDETRPCPNDLKSYLDVKYACVPVTDVTGEPCARGSPVVVRAGDAPGFLGSVVTEESGRGAADCPWLIQASPGQRINLTLYDFSAAPASVPDSGATSGGGISVCLAYAIIREKSVSRSQTLCGASGARVRHAYTSLSGAVEVRVLTGSATASNKHFILKYQVIGCPDLALPPQYAVSQSGDAVSVTCELTGQQWSLRCEGSEWSGGDVGNCSLDGAVAGVHGQHRPGSANPLAHGVSVVLIVTIALCLGLVILVAGVCCLRGRRLPHQPPPASLPHGGGFPAPGGKTAAAYQHNVHDHYKEQAYNSSTENEYAYISELSPPAAPPSYTRRNHGHMPGTTTQKCDYGTHAHGQTPPPPPPPHPTGTVRYVDSQDLPLPDPPPTYFELDPQNQKSSGGSRGMVGQRGGGGGGYRMEACPQFGGPQQQQQLEEDFLYNQSVGGEFVTQGPVVGPCGYDQLVDRGGSNHKSV